MNMPAKPLRTALTEIQEQIELGQAEPAMLQARYILKVFPKCLAAYRLLGQAYLESRQFADAADIFLRLLSSLPDDFIAHLGLALIREQQGDITAAAWHIQRAFEVRPSSQAIEQEVLRIEALRTSTPPSRQPLSRVALGRLYLQGGCYPQAIAEIQAARNENPHHPELDILLAQAYDEAGQLEDAAQAAQTALSQLPFSLEANRILYQAFSQEDARQARIYKERLEELDPYWALVTPELPDPTQVPDQAVMIEIP